ncbi:BCL2 modifying factor 2 [Corythoichthys intestinalis]|uniref:BCL2 modifying factor 2 n=1 Tax=Corythoichthys intestinalis TaxID=161448 RepID=UPI0025A58C22|nr:BCL2 modifying factor 2 [Corythoichthys intestinalis]
MDDEEEDTSRPVSQFRGTPFWEPKYEAESQRNTGVSGNNNNNSISALACNLPFHGNAALPSHFPAQFEPMEDRGDRRVAMEEDGRRREEDDRMAERPARQEAAVSMEVQIGQKLREIGDKFQQDHIDLYLRQQRQNLPVWMRLTMALLGFLFPRPPPVPRLRGANR